MEIDHVFASGAAKELRAEQRATPLVRGGASNHGSWRKNVVNSYTREYLERNWKLTNVRS